MSDSNLNKSFDASYLNRGFPRSNNTSIQNLRKNCSFSNLDDFETAEDFGEKKLNREAALSNITKQCGVLNSNDEFGRSIQTKH